VRSKAAGDAYRLSARAGPDLAVSFLVAALAGSRRRLIVPVCRLAGRLAPVEVVFADDAAVAVEAGAGLDDQFGDGEVASDPAAGHDFKAFGADVALEAAADHDVSRLQFSLDAARLPDGDFRLGTNRALDSTVNVKVVAQGKVADKF